MTDWNLRDDNILLRTRNIRRDALLNPRAHQIHLARLRRETALHIARLDCRRECTGGEKLKEMKTRSSACLFGKGELETGERDRGVGKEEILVWNRGICKERTGVGTCVVGPCGWVCEC